MNTLLWLGQLFLAGVFAYSGSMKASQPKEKLVAMGQTGVAHLPLFFIRFIGGAELVGVAGLLAPLLLDRLPLLTPLAALCLASVADPVGSRRDKCQLATRLSRALGVLINQGNPSTVAHQQTNQQHDQVEDNRFFLPAPVMNQGGRRHDEP